MGKKSIRIIPVTGERVKWRMRYGKLMARARIEVYDILLTCDNIFFAGDAYKTEDKVVSGFKVLNKTSYHEMVLAQ